MADELAGGVSRRALETRLPSARKTKADAAHLEGLKDSRVHRSFLTASSLTISDHPALLPLEQLRVDERDDPSLRYSGIRTDQAVELVVVSDCEREVAGRDAALVICESRERSSGHGTHSPCRRCLRARAAPKRGTRGPRLL